MLLGYESPTPFYANISFEKQVSEIVFFSDRRELERELTFSVPCLTCLAPLAHSVSQSRPDPTRLSRAIDGDGSRRERSCCFRPTGLQTSINSKENERAQCNNFITRRSG